MNELFVFDSGVYMVQLLQGISAFLYSGNYGQLLTIVGLLGVSWTAVTSVFNQFNMMTMARWMAIYSVILTGLYVPRVTVQVNDFANPALPGRVVADVPAGIGVMASMISQIGRGVTEAVETVFSAPGDLSYSQNGFLFGNNLLDRSFRFRMPDSLVAENIDAFMRQCVFYDLILGTAINMTDLARSDDIWTYISTNVNPGSAFDYRSRAGGGRIQRDLIRCDLGVGRLQTEVNNAITASQTHFGSQIFASRTNNENLARALLVSSLPNAYGHLLQASRSASDIMRQSMMVNAFLTAGENWAARGGAAGGLAAYARIRAERQTIESYKLQGLQGEKWLPLMRSVFQLLFIGSFPVALLLMLSPIGMTVFKSYFGGLLWLELWPPLFAVIHLVAQGRTADSLDQAFTRGGVTLQNMHYIMRLEAEIAVMAGYFTLSIPFLALGIMFGVSRLSSLATSLLAPAQQAAGVAASEVTTGNFSLGNTSFDNHSMNNLSANRLQTSPNIDHGRFSVADGHGADLRVGPTGAVAYSTGFLQSSLGADPQITGSVMRHAEDQYSLASSRLENASSSYALSTGRGLNDTFGLTELASQDASVREAWDQSTTADQRQSLDAALAQADNISQRHGLSRDDVLGFSAAASVGGGIVLKGETGVRFEGRYASNEAYDDIENFSKSDTYQNAVGAAQSIAQSSSFSVQDSQGQNLSASIQQSFSQAENLQEQRQTAQSRAETAQEVLRQAESGGLGFSQNLTTLFYTDFLPQKEQEGEIENREAFLERARTTPEGAMQLHGFLNEFSQDYLEKALGEQTRPDVQTPAIQTDGVSIPAPDTLRGGFEAARDGLASQAGAEGLTLEGNRVSEAGAVIQGSVEQTQTEREAAVQSGQSTISQDYASEGADHAGHAHRNSVQEGISDVGNMANRGKTAVKEAVENAFGGDKTEQKHAGDAPSQDNLTEEEKAMRQDILDGKYPTGG